MSDESCDNQRPKFYTLKPVTTPLPSRNKRDDSPESSTKHKEETSSQTAPHIRDINEDDDGYDPYSDYHEPSRLFEKDPWR